MAQRDQFVGALGRLDAGDPRHGEDVALGMAAVLDQLQGFRAHAHHGLGRGFTGGHGLSVTSTMLARPWESRWVSTWCS